MAVICKELAFIYGMKYGSVFVFFHMYIEHHVLSQHHHIEKLFPHWIALICSLYNWTCKSGSVFGLSIVHWSLCYFFKPISNFLDYISFKIILKIKYINLSFSVVFLLSIDVAILCLSFPLSIILSISTKMIAGILVGIAMNL